MAVYKSVRELIGATPMVALTNITKKENCVAQVVAKLEFRNPGGSVKDRVALNMLLTAMDQGIANKNTVIIEPTSGNTGIGLACVAASLGLQCIIVMPDSMSKERILLMQAYGAQVVLTPGALGMQGAIDKAEALAKEYANSFIPGQFENPANPAAHYCATGPEIWADTEGNVDIFVAGVGTGGTLSGVGKYLKEKNPAIQIVAVEPAASPLLSGGKAGKHGIQGIGANFVPKNLNRTVIDKVLLATEEDSFAAARALAATEGILCGISSGAALWAALEVAKRPENKGKTIVTLLPDTGERYLSTPLYHK